jgi:phosphatidylserine decarboxylase
VTFKNKGEKVYRGEKIGMIRFGSQVDIVLPGANSVSLSVNVGDIVKAGESIIGKILS